MCDPLLKRTKLFESSLSRDAWMVNGTFDFSCNNSYITDNPSL